MAHEHPRPVHTALVRDGHRSGDHRRRGLRRDQGASGPEPAELIFTHIGNDRAAYRDADGLSHIVPLDLAADLADAAAESLQPDDLHAAESELHPKPAPPAQPDEAPASQPAAPQPSEPAFDLRAAAGLRDGPASGVRADPRPAFLFAMSLER